MNKNLFQRPIDLGVDLSKVNLIPSCWMLPEEDEKMCDLSIIDKLLVILVEKEIAKMTNERKIFSAWDITKILRAAVGSGYEIKHGDVREVVKYWYENTGSTGKGLTDQWSRTLIELDNDKVTYVYHPLTVLAEGYPGFSRLADTMTKPTNPCNCANDEIFEAASNFLDDVEEFLEGRATLDELYESKESFEKFLDNQ